MNGRWLELRGRIRIRVRTCRPRPDAYDYARALFLRRMNIALIAAFKGYAFAPHTSNASRGRRPALMYRGRVRQFCVPLI